MAKRKKWKEMEGGFSPPPISPHTPLSGSNGGRGGVSALGGNQSADLGQCRAGRHPAIRATLSMTILRYDSH